jgi:hypothetical protein
MIATVVCTNSSACTANSAFGFKFGDPVPARATEVQVYYFSGGTDLMGFVHSVPKPLEGFEIYSHWSFKDKQSVYRILAYRQLISDKKQLYDDTYRASILEKAKLEIVKLTEAWGSAYGLQYKPESTSGLDWIAENSEVISRVGTMGGEYLYIECENKSLRQSAWAKALGR